MRKFANFFTSLFALRARAGLLILAVALMVLVAFGQSQVGREFRGDFFTSKILTSPPPTKSIPKNFVTVYQTATGPKRIDNAGTITSVVTELANVGLAAQGASISTANAYASAPTGNYKVTYYLVVSRAATSSSSCTVTIGWNDGVQGQTVTSSATSNTLGSFVSGSVIIHSGSAQNITYATTYASSGATSMQYALYMVVEAI